MDHRNPAEAAALTKSPPTALHDISRDLAVLVGRVAPSVVSFGTGRASRSGFVWRDGLIVTAEEALPDEENLPIVLPGGDTAEAKVVGRDAATDIALLKTDRGGLAALSAEPVSPTVGAFALAVGAAGGMPTAALGIVARVEGPWRSLRGGEIDARVLFDLRLPRSALEVLMLLAEGASNKAIAARLGISVHTAKFHVGSVIDKLDATGRTDAVAHAARLGVIHL